MNKVAPGTAATNRQPARSNNSNMNQPTPMAARGGGEKTTGCSSNNQGSSSSNSNVLTQPTPTTAPGEITAINNRHGPSSNNSNFWHQPTPVLSFHADPSDHFEAMAASLEVLIWGMPRACKCPGSSPHSKMC